MDCIFINPPCFVVPVGNMGPFSAWDSPFRAVGGLWTMSKIDSLVCAPCLSGSILLVSFSDTLLVVSILDMV